MLNLAKYVNNVKALQLFQLIRTGALFLISIVFTKTNPFTGSDVLKVGEIGIYESFLLIAGAVSFFWISGMLQSLLSTYRHNKTFNPEERNPIFFNIALLFTILGIVVAILVYILQGSISKLVGGIDCGKIPYMRILFFYIILSCPVNLIEYIYLLKNKAVQIIFYGVSTFTLQLICVTLPLLLGYDLGYGLYGLVFVNFIRFIWLIFLVYKYSEIRLSKGFLKEFINISSPLILSILIGGSATYIDSFLVSYKFDEATLAIFRYGAKELPFVSLLTAAFGHALTPTFSDPKNLDNALLNLKNGTRRLMHYIFPITLIILLTSKYLFPIVFNENFTNSVYIFNVYILIIITRFIFSRIILIGIHKTRIIFYSSIIELVVNVVLSIILINICGIVGVAIGTVVSYIIEKFYLVFYLKRKEKIKLSDYVDLKVYFLYTCALGICFLLSFII